MEVRTWGAVMGNSLRVLLCAGVFGLVPEYGNAALADAPENPPSNMSEAHSWAYQLQDISISEIAGNETFDFIVMDYSEDGGESGEWSAGDIDGIKDSNKLPVAYISIGEAENYRFYWDTAWETNPPAWLGPENPDWPGNFKVRFWHPEWQALIFQWLDRIVAQGFGGVYMDIIDAYYYWSEENPENPQADADMAQFVIDIHDYLNGGTGEKVVIPQNGSYIVVEDDVAGLLANQYFAAIDAIGVEDVFYYGDLDEDNPYNPDLGRLAMLGEYRAQGKAVLSIEYLTQPTTIEAYVAEAESHGFIPYASVRALDVLHDGLGTGVDVLPPRPEVFLTHTWPNPANPKTHFTLYLDRPIDLRLEIFTSDGRHVETLHDGSMDAGEYPMSWNADGRPSGLYLISARSAEYTYMRKALILK